MKKYMILIGILFFFAMTFPADAYKEQYWLRGKIRGYSQYDVVTVELINVSTGYVEIETSANKFGVYAFSDVRRGHPSQYKLRIYSGDRFVRELPLSNVRPGGWVPEIRIR
jgi:hypothetical protein